MWPRFASARNLSSRTASAASGLAPAAAALAALGQNCIALKLHAACTVPPNCLGINLAQQPAQRLAAGATLAAGAYLVHPGPYALRLQPHPEVAEIVLALKLVLDQPDPRLPEQRFDLFLRTEGTDQIEAAQFCAQLQTCVQQAVQDQQLSLQTCASAKEWQQFRAGLEKLLYVRFGWSVEACLPQDIGTQLDAADVLLAQAAQLDSLEASATPPQVRADNTANQAATQAPTEASPATANSRALMRRLFLELPALVQAWRQLPWPIDSALFAQRQLLFHRLDMISAEVATPAANAPDCGPALQQTLELAWARLAQMQCLPAAKLPQAQTEINTICQQWEVALRLKTPIPQTEAGRHD